MNLLDFRMRLRHIPFALLLIIGLIVVAFSANPETSRQSNSPQIDPMTTPPPDSADGVRVIGRYVYDLIPLEDKQIELYANHQAKLSSSELVTKYGCESATSGSFYGLDSNPIGLFISEGRQIQAESNSDLFIGFLSSVDGERIVIGRSAPTRVAWALQSGPIVWDGGPTVLRLATDKSARRIIAATDTSGRGYLIVLHTVDSIHDGPLLAELSQLVSDIGDREKFTFDTALNLDGGFHSFFIHADTRLSALATPGSVLCVRN